MSQSQSQPEEFLCNVDIYERTVPHKFKENSKLRAYLEKKINFEDGKLVLSQETVTIREVSLRVKKISF